MSAPLRQTSQSLALAVLLAATAGSIEAYSIVKLKAFAGAQTGNIVLGSIAVARGDWSETARYVWPILAFVGGVLLARTLQTGRVAVLVRWPYRAVLIAELITVVIVGLLPASTPHALVSVIITVAVAYQASTFRMLVDTGYNSAFSTGNLMNAITAAHTAFVTKSRTEFVHARRAFVVIGCYVVGAVGGALVSRIVGHPVIWSSAALLAAALILFVLDDRRRRQTVQE